MDDYPAGKHKKGLDPHDGDFKFDKMAWTEADLKLPISVKDSKQKAAVAMHQFQQQEELHSHPFDHNIGAQQGINNYALVAKDVDHYTIDSKGIKTSFQNLREKDINFSYSYNDKKAPLYDAFDAQSKMAMKKGHAANQSLLESFQKIDHANYVDQQQKKYGSRGLLGLDLADKKLPCYDKDVKQPQKNLMKSSSSTSWAAATHFSKAALQKANASFALQADRSKLAITREDRMRSLTRASIRRLARRGGVRRISSGSYKECRVAMALFLEATLGDALAYMKHARRNTVQPKDVLLALKRRGNPILGFGSA
ncbi:unnamed protein product [Amoebophrya sp. A120]|nr:unnamed protein product [Amoebophrya sp. A120]|eukprot:GSA120T00001792001.1